MINGKYVYETHLHTSEASACSKMHAEYYPALYKSLGYDGFIVTDHFYHGNTAVNRLLPWPEFIDSFCRGYELAKEAGDRIGIKVFFGWEENFRGDEFLVYGMTKEWMKEHPDMLDWDQKTLYEKVHADGGMVIQAHPFRDRDYIPTINLHPHQADGWEVNNSGNSADMDAFAYTYARLHGIRMTSGSDVHFERTSRERSGGMMFDEPLEEISDYVERVLTGQGIPILHEERMNVQPEYGHTRPVLLFDENNVAAEYDDSELR